MQGNNIKDISTFYIAGINYKKTDASVRGQFAINNAQYEDLLLAAPQSGISELFVLSTCNRTEIYGFAEDPGLLIELLCTKTQGDSNTFTSLAYIKKGVHAVQHLFNVAAGLDSQILGDYEIVGQIKQSVKFSRERNFIGSFTERLVNAVLQSSKMIRNQTGLSGGTVSVSFAAVQYIKQNVPHCATKRILLLGVGKIGRNTCKNLVDYLETKNITLVNRSLEKAQALAEELGLRYAPYKQAGQFIQSSDIIIVATNATSPILTKKDIKNYGHKLIIDLSVPSSLEPGARELKNIDFVDVDELSSIKDKTIKKRAAEVPKAQSIIKCHLEEFLEWHEMRKHVSVLKAVKIKLMEITTDRLLLPLTSSHVNTAFGQQEKIQQVINVLAVKMRRKNQRGCHYIEAINDFMATGSTKSA
ncbi:MAG: glutamyl-tRNA reductase [Chitinophagaceae bacterium]